MSFTRQLSCIAFVIGSILQVQAQGYTDYTPSFSASKNNLTVDRVEHTDRQTIVFVRFMADLTDGNRAVFYGPGQANAWSLSTSGGSKMELKEMRRIAVNGQVTNPVLLSGTYDVAKTKGTQYTFQLVFDKVPSGGTVNLSDGGSDFRILNLKIEPNTPNTLGLRDDMVNRIKQFEQRNQVNEPTDFTLLPYPANNATTTAASTASTPQEPMLRCVVKVKFLENKLVWHSMELADQYLSFVAKYLYNNPDSYINIKGHSDVYQAPMGNQTISEKRAQAVKDYIIKRNVCTPERIKTCVGVGSAEPLYPNGSGHNRRVEIEIWN